MAVGNSTVSISLPNIKIPLTDHKGTVQQQWWRFLQGLYTAVGANPVDLTSLETQITQVSAIASGAAVNANAALVASSEAKTDAANAQVTAADALALQSLAFDAGSTPDGLLTISDILAFDTPEAATAAPVVIEGDTIINQTTINIGDDLAQEVADLREALQELQAYVYALNTDPS